MWPLFVGLVGSGKFRITEHKTLTSRSSDLGPPTSDLRPPTFPQSTQTYTVKNTFQTTA